KVTSTAQHKYIKNLNGYEYTEATANCFAPPKSKYVAYMQHLSIVDDSADEENEEEEDENIDRIIEESLKNLDNRAENMQVGLIDQFITTENDKDVNENENVAQEVMETIDLRSLKSSSREFLKSETSWKSQQGLKQYLPMKPHKWGFKMFTRASEIVV
ncbi:unnamed protein product, partial [Ceratitis capitata]